MPDERISKHTLVSDKAVLAPILAVGAKAAADPARRAATQNFMMFLFLGYAVVVILILESAKKRRDVTGVHPGYPPIRLNSKIALHECVYSRDIIYR